MDNQHNVIEAMLAQLNAINARLGPQMGRQGAQMGRQGARMGQQGALLDQQEELLDQQGELLDLLAQQLQQLRAVLPVAREARPAAREARPAAAIPDQRNESDYRCNLRKMQCKARLPNGNRCSRNTIKTIPYCWQHGISLYGLQVKPSVRVPGQLGIFATRDFASDVVIIDHPYGELVSDRAIRRRYGDFDSPFVIPTHRVDKFWDDTCSRGLMGYVQDDIPDLMAYNPAGYNTEYQIGRNKNNIMLVTTKAIVAGDELTVDKGMDPDNVQYPRTLWREDRRLENRFLRDDRYGDTTYTRRLGRARRR